MSQKSKLRRRQRNRTESDREDEPQPGHGDAEAYFEQMRREWEESKLIINQEEKWTV